MNENYLKMQAPCFNIYGTSCLPHLLVQVETLSVFEALALRCLPCHCR